MEGGPPCKLRSLFLAFILFNLVILPLVGIFSRSALSAESTGAPLPPYEGTTNGVGEGIYKADAAAFSFTGQWEVETVPADRTGAEEDALYRFTAEPDARYDFAFSGQKAEITYSTGPDRGIWVAEIDGHHRPAALCSRSGGLRQ